MPVSVVNHTHFKIFRRTDVQSAQAIIFAHGRNNNQQCNIPMGVSLHFIVDDGRVFNFQNTDMQRAFRGGIRPRHSQTGGAVPDYDLRKAAGTHIDTVAARQSYGRLSGLADVSDSMNNANAPDPNQNIHLGQGVPCDVISIRNRLSGTPPSLAQLILHPDLAQYQHLHCFFCREAAGGGGAAQLSDRI